MIYDLYLRRPKGPKGRELFFGFPQEIAVRCGKKELSTSSESVKGQSNVAVLRPLKCEEVEAWNTELAPTATRAPVLSELGGHKLFKSRVKIPVHALQHYVYKENDGKIRKSFPSSRIWGRSKGKSRHDNSGKGNMTATQSRPPARPSQGQEEGDGE